MTGVTAGIDLGSCGLRVAWAGTDGQVVEVENLCPVTDRPWITATGSLTSGGIVFVSANQLSRRAVPQIVAELAAARERIRSESGADIDRAVLTVPARVGSRDRVARRDAVRAAGFAEVHLVNDSVAAVLADGDGAGVPRTVVVYAMGYSGFELGLVRMARRQVRVLGHAGGATPSGRLFDNSIINSWISALHEHDKHSLVDWTGPDWERLRSAAEDVKHRLAAGDKVACRWPPWSDGADQNRPELPTPAPDVFDVMIRQHVDTTLVRARDLLADADLTTRDVDAVVLVGGSTALLAVSSMLSEEFGIEPRTTGPNHFARGAATYGAQLQPTTAIREPEFLDEPADDASLATLSIPLPAIVGPASTIAPKEDTLPDVLATARRLWSEGKTDEARELLGDLVVQAQRLLTEIDAAAEMAAAGSVTSVAEIAPEIVPEITAEARERGRRAIGRARRWLKRGKLKDAVSESHRALDLAPGDQEIFDQMIEMHLDAARAVDGPDDYKDARYWLDCARVHARFNETVIAYLAERTHAQARHHHDHGRTVEALSLLEECLDLAPHHGGARALRAEIAVQQGL